MREDTEPAADLISFKHSNTLQQDNIINQTSDYS